MTIRDPLPRERRIYVVLSVALIVFTAAQLTPSPADAAVLLNETFDLNTSNFSGKAGFNSKYCKDSWTTALNGGVIAKTDDGCTCSARGQSACDFAVYTARGNTCYKSEAVDNILVTGKSSWTDYTMTVKLRNLDNDTMGVVFRYVNTANFYAVWFSRDVGPGVTAACDGSFPGARLVKFSAKTGSGKGELIASSQLTYQIGKVHLLRVRVKGNSIVVHFDADADGVIDNNKELLFNAVDPTHTQGAVGLYAYQNGASYNSNCAKGGCWFDDLKVESIEPVVAPDAGSTDPDVGTAPDSGGGPEEDTSAGAKDDAGGDHDGGVHDSGVPADAAMASDDVATKDAAATLDAPPSQADGLVSDVGPPQVLTLTVLGEDEDSGCSAGPSGRPSGVWWLSALAVVVLLARRRRLNAARS